MRIAPAAAAIAAVVAAAALFAACPRPLRSLGASRPGCGKDTDCKGTRVCEQGRCVDPRPGTIDPQARGPTENDNLAASQHIDSASQQDGGVAAPPIALPGASPMFHQGWTHSGRSRFRVSHETPRKLGKLATGGTVYSSPAITDDGLAIFGSHDKSIHAAALAAKGEGRGLVQRWSSPTGDLVWCSPALGPGAGAGAGPVVYVGSDDDRLYALEASDGTVHWTFTAGPCKRAIGFGPEAARCDVDGVTVGPDGTIYFVADGAYALNPDGALKWRFAEKTHCAAAPAVGPDGSVYFGCQDGRLYAVGPDGSKRWDYRTGDDVDSSPAVAADGTIYFGSDDSRLYALTPSGVLKWALKTGGDVRSSPALAADGTVYVGSFDGNLYAVRGDGSVIWTFSTADRILSSPVIDPAGVVLIGSQDDRLYAVAPDGKLLWSVLLDGDVDGTAAIGEGGVIFVGSDDKALHVLR